MFTPGHQSGRLAKDEASRRNAGQSLKLHRGFGRGTVNPLSKAKHLHAADANLSANGFVGQAAGGHPLSKNGHAQ